MHAALFQEGAKIRQAASLELTKTRNKSSTLVYGDSTIVDTTKALVNYAGTVDVDYDITFFYECINDIYNNFSHEYLPKTTRRTYRRYISLSRLYIEGSALNSLLKCLSTGGRMTKNLGISFLVCSIPYSFEPEKVMSMVGIAYCFIESPQTAACSLLFPYILP